MTDPMPRNFGLKYVLWFLWSNSITILGTIQSMFAVLLIFADPAGNDPDYCAAHPNVDLCAPLIPHLVARWIVLTNAALTVLVARVKRNNPPGPPPTRS